MKKMLVFFIVAIAGIVFADELAPLSPKERELLQAYVKLTESHPIIRVGDIKIYNTKEKENSGQVFRSFSGCVPVERIEDGVKKSYYKLFEISVSRVTENNILTIYNEKKYPIDFFSPCPDKENLRKVLEEKSPKE